MPRCRELERRQYLEGGAGLGEEVENCLGKLPAMVRPEARIEVFMHLVVPFHRIGFALRFHEAGFDGNGARSPTKA